MKIGDRVKLIVDRYDDNKMNPYWNGEHGKILGTIDSFRQSGKIQVKWDNGFSNHYHTKGDLELFEQEWNEEENR